MRPTLAALALLSLLTGCRQATAPAISTEAPPAYDVAIAAYPTLRDVRVAYTDDAIVVSAKGDARVLAQVGRTWTFRIDGGIGGAGAHLLGPGLSREIWSDPPGSPGVYRESTLDSLAVWSSGDWWRPWAGFELRGATMTVTIPRESMEGVSLLVVEEGFEENRRTRAVWLLFRAPDGPGHGLDEPEFEYPLAEEPVALRRR